MREPNQSNPGTQKAFSPRAAIWLWLSIAAGLLAAAGSLIALAEPGIYASLSAAFLPQALAQDIANLALVSPALLILAALALRGSLRAYLLWLGVLLFTFYNYVIYTFSVPFGRLFLLWVAVLGMSIYTMIGGLAEVDHRMVKAGFSSRRAVITTAWVLIVASLLFAWLWLSEDVPALLAGSTPQSLIDLGVPTNPVHILDLSFFLPSAILTGVLLLRGIPLGYSLAPPLLVFMLLTGVPIMITPAVQAWRGEAAAWELVVPIGALSLILLGILIWLMSSLRHRRA